ncbi:hypothetical protein J3459_006291 [Metarhizium acridum]|nr:hypothetical protein J3459_006291 [Metarhizium acridum]
MITTNELYHVKFGRLKSTLGSLKLGPEARLKTAVGLRTPRSVIDESMPQIGDYLLVELPATVPDAFTKDATSAPVWDGESADEVWSMLRLLEERSVDEILKQAASLGKLAVDKRDHSTH